MKNTKFKHGANWRIGMTPRKANRAGIILIVIFTISYFILFQNVIPSQSEKAIQFFSSHKDRPSPQKPSEFSIKLTLCENQVYAETKFSFVSMLSGNLRLYAISAIKLGSSIRRWSSLDMVMMEIKERPLDPEIRSQLQSAGWKVCIVPAIDSPPTKEKNPYLDALMYSKLNAWGLDQYDAIVAIDSDMLVVGNPAPLFEFHLPRMQAANRTIGAARDRPRSSCSLVSWATAPYNAGLLLFRPDTATLDRLRRAIIEVPHDVGSAEQVQLNQNYGICEPPLDLVHTL
jgi:hypothetical protein